MRRPSILLRWDMLDQQVGGWNRNIQMLFRLRRPSNFVLETQWQMITHFGQNLTKVCYALAYRKLVMKLS